MTNSKLLYFILVLCLNLQLIFAQKITPEIELKIKEKVNLELGKFLKRTTINKYQDKDLIEFILDTMKIEKTVEYSINYDFTTTGMNSIVFKAGQEYDALMNKYYKKLLAILQKDDKQVLIDAQRAWLTPRDLEMKLIQTVSKPQYSGGGSIQSNLNVSDEQEMIKERVVSLFNYFTRAKGEF